MEAEDFLSVDKPVPGQNFVCISFVSPEKTLKKKENYIFYKYLKQEYDIQEEFETFDKKINDFELNEGKNIDDEFSKIEGFKTSIRGVKVRGTYDTYEEASVRAKVLGKMDSSFHVFVGQVGYWLPWDPNPDNVADQKYQEEHLNNLVSRYKENEIKRDEFYAKETEERKKKCLEDNMEKNESNEHKDIMDNDLNHSDLKKNFEDFSIEK